MSMPPSTHSIIAARPCGFDIFLLAVDGFLCPAA